MENKISGLTLLAERIPIVKAYKQFAWQVNNIKRTEGAISGADILNKCLAVWQQESNKHFLQKWKISLLDFEKAWCPDRYIAIHSLPAPLPENHQHLSSLLIGSTAPNVNIVLEMDTCTHRACWKYYDALDKKMLPQALQVVINLLHEKEIRLLQVQEIAHRINVNHLRGLCKKQNVEVEKIVEAPTIVIPPPAQQTPN